MEYDNGEILRRILKIDGRAVRMRQCEAVSESAVCELENLLSEEFSEEFAVYRLCLCLPTRVRGKPYKGPIKPFYLAPA